MIIESKDFIEASNVYAGCVAEFENIWPDNNQVIQTIENELTKRGSDLYAYWRRAKVGAYNGISDIRTNTLFPIQKLSESDKTCKDLNDRFYKDASSALMWYTDYFKINEKIYKSEKERLTLLRYQTGQKYNAHYDGGMGSFRIISPILYINDDYEGGELEFVHHNLKIKPKAGSLYLFPANYAYMHVAHPVKSGTKYALVTFFHDRPEVNNESK